MGIYKRENAENKNEEMTKRYWRRIDRKVLKIISTEKIS